VTVLFSDVTGSTALGEQLDPEAVRALMGRYFAAMKAVIERHGGTVEKFIGDAVMAVFGIPSLHEDDALRAVRAAAQMREALAALNTELATERGVTIQTRTGITTGEVVAGDPSAGQTLVTGDTVNTAARLEQAAAPGEILIGEPTWRLVRDAVSAESVAAISAKGKALPVPAYRLVSVAAGVEGHLRRMDAPLVGRERELRLLTEAWHRAHEERFPQLFTLLGAAGVGKSRLVREATTVVEARTYRGRCLPYGDGITYWPMREILLEAAGVSEIESPMEIAGALKRLVSADASAELLARRLGSAIGIDDASTPQEEIFWAVRRTLELMAGEASLLLVIEDIHWAEPTLLDLLDYLSDMGAASMMLLVTARPELLDVRPGWSGGDKRQLLRLEPLGVDASEALLLAQPGGEAVPPDLRRRILEAAEGNALYVEEMLGMLRDSGALKQEDNGWVASEKVSEMEVPPTVRALLAARLDRLPPDERTLTSRAAVVGRSFEAAALSHLAPSAIQTDLGRRLLSLVRKELLRPDQSQLSMGDAFRFRHVLIRDAAYAMLAKAERASLHERFADWLESNAAGRIGEFAEIVAYHLESALSYREELGAGGVGGLRGRVGRWTLDAGLRAMRRDDRPAAVTFLRKASEFGRDAYEVESVALRNLTDLYQESGDFGEAEAVIDRALDIATAAGDQPGAAVARIQRLYVHRHTDAGKWAKEAEEVGPAAIAILEAAGDDLGLAAAWHAMAIAAWPDLGRMGPSEERALAHARASGDRRWLGWTIGSIPGRAIVDETPVSEAIATVNSIRREIVGLGSLFEASVTIDLAVLEAMAGDYETALHRAEEARDVHRQFGHHMDHALSTGSVTMIHRLGGRLERAEPALRESVAFLTEIGETGFGPYLCAHLARCLAEQGRHDEALAFVERAQVDEVDPVREVLWRTALSRSHADTGDHTGAIHEAEQAAGMVTPETPTRRALVLLDLAYALETAGRRNEAEAALAEAHRLAERKGNVAVMDLIVHSRRLNSGGSQT